MSILDCLLHSGMDGFKPSYHLGTPLENLSQGIKYVDEGYWLPDNEIEPILIKNMDLIHIISTKKGLKKAYEHYSKRVRNENSYKIILGMIEAKLKEFDKELKRRGCVPMNIILPEDKPSINTNKGNVFIQFTQDDDCIELLLRTPNYYSHQYKNTLAHNIQKVLGSSISSFIYKEKKIKGKTYRNPLWFIDKAFRHISELESIIENLEVFCKENSIGFKHPEITPWEEPKAFNESDLEDLDRNDVFILLQDLVEDGHINETTLLDKIEHVLACKPIYVEEED